MLVLNDAQAVIVEDLLTRMLIGDAYSVGQLEEATLAVSAKQRAWFQQERDRVSCPFEQVWSKNLAQEIVRELRRQN